jgi:release factor glutamine methyltransferase
MSRTVSQLSCCGQEELSGLLADRDVLALEVDVLLAHALGTNRAGLIAHSNEVVEPAAVEVFEDYIARRKRREPVAYITGVKEFYSLPFIVTPDVLIPRPETELLVEQTLAVLDRLSGKVLLVDVGTGSGAIVLSIMAELRQRSLGASVSAIAIDVSTKALDVARLNAEALGLSSMVQFVESDCLAKLVVPSEVQTILIASNPPYVATSAVLEPDVLEYEPASALFAGEEGLDIIRQLIGEASQLKGLDIRMVLEIGETQGNELDLLLRQASFRDVFFSKDLWGCTRVVEAAKYDA